MIRRSRVVIVICPSLEETVRGIDAAARDGAHRERARVGRRRGDAGSRRRPCAGRSASTSGTPVVLYTGTFEAYQGLDLLFAAMAIVRARAAGRAPGARGRQAGAGRARAGPGRGRGDRRGDDLRRASGRRPTSRRFCSPRDVLVSPRSRGTNTPLKIYQYLRSGKPIVATRLLTHTQVLERRHGHPHRRDRRRSSPTASSRRWPILTARGAGRRARPRARGDEVQLRRVSRADPRRRAPRSAVGAARWRRRQGRRVSGGDARTHYSYTRLRRPGDGAHVRRAAVRRADRRARSPRRRRACCEHARRRVQGRRDPRRRHRHRPRGAAAGPRGRGRHRRRRVRARCSTWRGGARPRSTRVTVRARRRARAGVPRLEFDVVVCLRVLMHTPRLAPVRRRAVPRGRAPGGLRLPGGRQRRARSSRSRRTAHALGGATEAVPGALRPRDSGDARGERLPRPLGASPIRAADRAAQARSDRRALHDARRGRARSRIGLLRLLGSPVTVVAERCASSSPARPVSPGGHLARRLAAHGDTVRALVRDAHAGARDLAAAGIALVAGDLRERGALDRAVGGRRRRLPHRGAVPAGRAAGRRAYRAVNATAVRDVDRGRGARGRAPRRALQHGRRARRRRASAGERRRAAAAGRRLPGDEGRRRAARARGGARGPASRSTIARPTGIYGPGDRRLLKLFRGVARRRFVDAGPRRNLLPSDVHRRSGRRLPAVRRASGRGRTAPTSSRAGK